ncbi:MAG: TetR/AcrR family transcriptional regulator, partial [Blastococcus sp.]
MARNRHRRVADLGDAGIRILASRGRHALTHRAVDAEAGLPLGSASYYARTRDALLLMVVDRIAELDAAGTPAAAASAPLPVDVPALADALAGLVHHQLTTHRARTLARYELSMEAVHHPSLRAALDRAGERFHAAAAELMAGAGSTDPVRHGRFLVAVCDGLVFDALAGAGSAHPPSLADLRAGLRYVVGSMLPSPDE